jgi:hypothetical protein
MVRVQRQLSDIQCKFILRFLKPLSERFGFWLCYEIDDVVGRHDIPKYNSGWSAFQNDQLMANMEMILQVCDVITVTTQELANYYVTRFGAPKEKMYVLPNYMPRWWIGDSYSERKISTKYNEMDKPRIGFISSTTHFDIANVNNGVDDFSHVNDYVRDTIDEYQWVFVGGVPQPLKDLHEAGKIEFHPGFDILNYPRIVGDMNLHTIVAPLQDNVFNRCKSNIKLLEAGALGIPCIVQDLAPYRQYTDLMFNDANDLDNQIAKVLKTKENYMDIVKLNRDMVDNGNSKAPNGWWLENNMDKWFKLFSINQKTLRFDLGKLDQPRNAVPSQISTPPIEEITFEV